MTAFFFVFIWPSFLWSSDTGPFSNTCVRNADAVPYCRNVGKRAFNSVGIKAMREIYIGPIVGVAWKMKGALVSRPGETIRLAPRDSYYYIIGPGGVANHHFLRQAVGIDARRQD